MKGIESDDAKTLDGYLPLPERKPLPEGKVTFEEFLEWSDEDIWAEWVDGEIIVMSPASNQHQQIGGFLHKVLGLYIETKGLGMLFFPPFAIRLPIVPRAPEPDLLYVATEHLDRLTDTYLNGVADVVVEIVSKESIRRDYERKFADYQRAGVPEYWLIDPLEEKATFYHLSERGSYEQLPIESDTTFRSQEIPGFWFKVDWLWDMPVRDAFPVLRQLMPDMGADTLRQEIEARQQAELKAQQERFARLQAERRAEQETHRAEQEAHRAEQEAHRAEQEVLARQQAEQRAELTQAELSRLRSELEALRDSEKTEMGQ